MKFLTLDRVLLATALVGVSASLVFHRLEITGDMRWNAFVHCRLMDLETGDTSHVCRLGEDNE